MTIDMNEVTRLTRLGRLDEAMAMLRCEGSAAVAPDIKETPGDFIEMVQSAGAVWSAGFEAATDSVAKTAKTRKPKVKLADLVQQGAGFGRHGHGLSPAVVVPDGARFSEHSFTSAAGSRGYKLYVPTHRTGRPLPLIVMLHGCTQSPDDFAAGTRMNELAEAHGFVVAYPAQGQTANMNRCWNWFNAADQQRDHGEPAILAGMVREIISEEAIDPARVFIAGLSAGGGMAAIMGAAYPEMFAGVGVHSGLPVGVAHDMPSAFAAMQGAGARSSAAITVPTIVFHGDADTTVQAGNGKRVVEQASSRDLKAVRAAGVSAGGGGYTKTSYVGDRGTVVEDWVIHGAGHAWAGGNAAGSFTDPKGPDASTAMVRFFLALPVRR